MNEHESSPTPPPSRDELGRWLPGQSANPAGKKPGTRHWSREVKDMLREKSAVHVLSALHKQAMLGNVRAAEVLLSYVMAPHRPNDETDALAEPGTIGEQAATIVRRMTEGELAPAEAKDALEVLQMAAQIDEVEMLRQKLDSMEAAIAAGQHGINP